MRLVIARQQPEDLPRNSEALEKPPTSSEQPEVLKAHKEKSKHEAIHVVELEHAKPEVISPGKEEIVAELVLSQNFDHTTEIKNSVEEKDKGELTGVVTSVKQEGSKCEPYCEHTLLSCKTEPLDDPMEGAAKEKSGIRVRIRSKFTCGFCKYTCTESYNMKKHHKENHQTKLLYLCEPCYFVSHNKYNYKTHFKVAHADDSTVPTGPINLDDMVFPETPEIIVHTIRSYNYYLKTKCAPSIKCQFCTFRTAYGHCLKDHITSRHYTCVSETLVNIADDSRTYRCITCGTIADTKDAVSSHYVQAHVSLPTFDCELCEINIKDKSQLLGHMKTGKHRESYRRSLKCPDCQFATLSKKALRKHAGAKHKLSVKKAGDLACDKCDHVAISKNNLNMHKAKVHMIVKGEDGLYQCNECDYKTNNKEKLMYHAKSASGHAATKTSVKCDVCDFVARNQNGMMYHKNVIHGKSEADQES
ncbi:hypothetical protein ACHWQZ_G002244 [Mnemiopsis leidyi]